MVWISLHSLLLHPNLQILPLTLSIFGLPLRYITHIVSLVIAFRFGPWYLPKIPLMPTALQPTYLSRTSLE